MNVITHARTQDAVSGLRDAATVFIVDGDAAMREALRSLVRAAGWQASTAASAEEFLAPPRGVDPCCVLVEQHLPGSSGFDLQDLLCDRADLPFIFMSGRADVEGTVRAMKAGALEFLPKPFDDHVLLCAIDDAIERSRATLRESARIRELEDRYERLSRREREVMGRVVVGRLNKQIGDDLGISEITVKAHRGQVMRKMKAPSLAELVRMASRLRASAPRDWPDASTSHPRAGARLPQKACAA